MRNGAQPAQKTFEFFIAQQQRVAATQQHVTDFLVLRDIFDLLVEFGMKIIAVRVADEPRARAITAIRGAPVGDQKQHAVGIPVHQTGHGRVRILAARVAHFPGRSVCFLDTRNDLPPDGTVLIHRIDQVEKIRRDGQRKLVVCEFRAGELLRRERGHQALQLFRRRDAVFELPAPVVPLGIRNVAPEAAPGGAKLLQTLESVV